jgi:hypothetical protein
MRHRIVQCVIGVMFAVGGLGLTAMPASADLDYTQCPAITGSITRLYSAYFERPPDAPGFAFWADQWGTGARSFGNISDAFVQSPEFQRTYGGLSNQEFVDVVYRNVLGRVADLEGREFWVGRLNGGMTRGVMMLQFSESAEFVAKTGTKPFFGGLFQTFPTGTVFYCEVAKPSLRLHPLTTSASPTRLAG